MPATDGALRLAAMDRSARGWPIRQAGLASIWLALGLGAFLIARRSTGALAAPLAPAQLVVTAVLLSAWALAVCALAARRLSVWSVAVALFAFAVACSYPGERVVDWIVWLTVFGAFIASHGVASNVPARLATAIEPRSPACVGERVLQRLTRSRTASGQDVMRGTLVAEFAAGERTATVYVAFCPPFERWPRVEVESPAAVKVVQALHNGAQLEVRLPRAAATSTTADIEFFATDAELL